MRNRTRFASGKPLSLAAVFLLACTIVPAQHTTDEEWPYYGHDSGGMRYSRLTQINRSNVAKLKIAWVYHTGDISDGTNYPRKSEFESTPVLVDGTLYVTTPFNRVIALDPKSGRERWAFDPKINLGGEVFRRADESGSINMAGQPP